VRELAPLLLLAALAVPFGDAGASPFPVRHPCDLRESIRADLGAGKGDLLGPDLLAPAAIASPAPAQAPPGGSDGPRRGSTVGLRRDPRVAAARPAGPVPSTRARRDGSWRAALGPALRVYPAHPSTAPPRSA
jgi:hypothetical protein